MLRGLSLRHFDFWLLGAVILAIAFGVVVIESAIAGNQQLIDYPQRQITFALIGLGVLVFMALMDYHYWAAIHWPIYLVTMLLLVYIFITAQEVFGAARWFQIGDFFVQPTELAKIVLILTLARYFEKNFQALRNLRWIVLSFMWVFWLMIWIFLQPNLSNVIVMLVIWISLLWISGLPVKYIFIFGSLAILLGAVGLLAPFSPLEEYQRQRVFTFLFPDPNARHGATYNVEQALIAIGSGGISGTGYSLGTQVQNRFLKVRHTDFIFSGISEEFGFIGAVLVVLLILFIVYRCFRAGRLARDVSGSIIAYGVGVLIFFQGAVNIAVNLNLIPVTGLPLPFISYGGSGLLSLMLGIGLVESVIMRHKALEF